MASEDSVEGIQESSPAPGPSPVGGFAEADDAVGRGLTGLAGGVDEDGSWPPRSSKQQQSNWRFLDRGFLGGAEGSLMFRRSIMVSMLLRPLVCVAWFDPWLWQ